MSEPNKRTEKDLADCYAAIGSVLVAQYQGIQFDLKKRDAAISALQTIQDRLAAAESERDALKKDYAACIDNRKAALGMHMQQAGEWLVERERLSRELEGSRAALLFAVRGWGVSVFPMQHLPAVEAATSAAARGGLGGDGEE